MDEFSNRLDIAVDCNLENGLGKEIIMKNVS